MDDDNAMEEEELDLPILPCEVDLVEESDEKEDNICLPAANQDYEESSSNIRNDDDDGNPTGSFWWEIDPDEAGEGEEEDGDGSGVHKDYGDDDEAMDEDGVEVSEIIQNSNYHDDDTYHVPVPLDDDAEDSDEDDAKVKKLLTSLIRSGPRDHYYNSEEEDDYSPPPSSEENDSDDLEYDSVDEFGTKRKKTAQIEDKLIKISIIPSTDKTTPNPYIRLGPPLNLNVLGISLPPSSPKFMCKICGNLYNMRIGLRGHMVRAHGEVDELTRIKYGDIARPYRCSSCGRGFGHKSNLTRHKKEHCNKQGNNGRDEKKRERPFLTRKPVFTCTRCGTAFGRSSHLARHKKHHCAKKGSHSDEEGSQNDDAQSSYVCTACKTQFSSSDHLARHKKHHCAKRGSNPDEEGSQSDDAQSSYVCTICEKRFCRSDHLTRHKKLKHGLGESRVDDGKDRPYHCTQCDKRFVRKSHLTRHKKQNCNGSIILTPTTGIKKKKDSVKSDLSDNDESNDGNGIQLLKNSSKYKPGPKCSKERRFRTRQNGSGSTPTYPPSNNNDFIKPDDDRSDEGIQLPKNVSKSKPGPPCSKERPYLCLPCGKRFTSEDHVKRHKKFSCRGAKLTPTDAKSDEDSIMSNDESEDGAQLSKSRPGPKSSKERPHLCTSCGKRFIRADHLKRHKKLNCRGELFTPKIADPKINKEQSGDDEKHLLKKKKTTSGLKSSKNRSPNLSDVESEADDEKIQIEAEIERI